MGALRLGSFLILVVLYGVYVVGREPMCLEAWVFSSSGDLVWHVCRRRECRYVEAWVFSSSGGTVWCVRSRA